MGPCTPLCGTADLRPVHRLEILKTGPLACSQLISSPARHCGCWGGLVEGAESSPMELTSQWESTGGDSTK